MQQYWKEEKPEVKVQKVKENVNVQKQMNVWQQWLKM